MTALREGGSTNSDCWVLISFPRQQFLWIPVLLHQKLVKHRQIGISEFRNVEDSSPKNLDLARHCLKNLGYNILFEILERNVYFLHSRFSSVADLEWLKQLVASSEEAV